MPATYRKDYQCARCKGWFTKGAFHRKGHKVKSDCRVCCNEMARKQTSYSDPAIRDWLCRPV